MKQPKVGDMVALPELTGFPGSGTLLTIMAICGKLLAYKRNSDGQIKWIEFDDWAFTCKGGKVSAAGESK